MKIYTSCEEDKFQIMRNNYYEGENNSLGAGESENANCEWENEFFNPENKRFRLITPDSASKLLD